MFSPICLVFDSFTGSRRHCTHRRVQRRTEKMLQAQQAILCLGECTHKTLSTSSTRLAWHEQIQSQSLSHSHLPNEQPWSLMPCPRPPRGMRVGVAGAVFDVLRSVSVVFLPGSTCPLRFDQSKNRPGMSSPRSTAEHWSCFWDASESCPQAPGGVTDALLRMG